MLHALYSSRTRFLRFPELARPFHNSAFALGVSSTQNVPSLSVCAAFFLVPVPLIPSRPYAIAHCPLILFYFRHNPHYNPEYSSCVCLFVCVLHSPHSAYSCQVISGAHAAPVSKDLHLLARSLPVLPANTLKWPLCGFLRVNIYHLKFTTECLQLPRPHSNTFLFLFSTQWKTPTCPRQGAGPHLPFFPSSSFHSHS